MFEPIVTLPAISGRDFIVGDPHGMLHKLEAILNGNNFNPEKDRVIACGDLINRGPNSLELLLLLKKPWFFSVRGNHEEMLARIEDPAYYRCIMSNGGDWLTKHSDKEVKEFSRLSDTLPYALSFKSGDKHIGVVHANVPLGMSWDELTVLLNGNANTPLIEHDKAIKPLLWQKADLLEMSPSEASIEGVDEVYFGHTVFPVPRHIANRHYIDTGAVYKEPSSSVGNVLTCHVWCGGNYREVTA